MQVLDFDFERFCSVSLSNLNVYACLVCGKYYQGRGRKSHAYTHSLEAGHHVYINLRTEKVYCLPDGYEISDPSLDDIRHVLNPRFVLLLGYCFHLFFLFYSSHLPTTSLAHFPPFHVCHEIKLMFYSIVRMVFCHFLFIVLTWLLDISL